LKLNIRQWFASPEIADAEIDQHRVVLMNAMINSSIVFVVLITLGNLFDRSTPLRNFIIDLLLLAVFLIARAALHHGKILFAGISALTLGFAFTIISIISDGSVRSTAVSLLLLIIIISGIIYKITGIVISTIASSLAIFVLILAQNAGLIHESISPVSMLHWFVLTITFIIVGGIIYFSDHVTTQALKHAKEEVQERQRAESNLVIANQELQKRMMEVEKLKDELQDQALHDSLTGLPNRRHLKEILPHEFLRAERNNHCLSIIFADIDNFKTINDSYGHFIGDQFLVKISQLLQSELRRSDYVYRYGGDEFVLVMPDLTVDSAIKRAEGIRKECSKIIIHNEGNDLGVTMSLGIAVYPMHGQKWEEIIEKADQALYDAKRLGRNRVRTWAAGA
jgi:diguanylate cyclase (GGDEF)-like protein